MLVILFMPQYVKYVVVYHNSLLIICFYAIWTRVCARLSQLNLDDNERFAVWRTTPIN